MQFFYNRWCSLISSISPINRSNCNPGYQMYYVVFFITLLDVKCSACKYIHCTKHLHQISLDLIKKYILLFSIQEQLCIQLCFRSFHTIIWWQTTFVLTSLVGSYFANRWQLASSNDHTGWKPGSTSTGNLKTKKTKNKSINTKMDL